MVAIADTPATPATANAPLPVLDLEINEIATTNGLQPGFVASQILQAGGMVAQVGERLLTSQVAWNEFVRQHIRCLQGQPPTKSARAATRKPPQAKAEPGATPPETVRFKSFKLSNSYAKSLGNFLEAQKWPAEKRIAIVEAIAQLSATQVGDESAIAEQCLKRLIGAYPAAKRRGNTTRQGLIDAAKAMVGSLAA